MSADVYRAALTAYRCLIHAHVDTLPVQPLDLLKKCRNTVAMSMEQAADSLAVPYADLLRGCDEADAWTYRQAAPDGEARYIVVFRTDGHPGRRRFSLAHELGHIALRHTPDDPWAEQEADVFASHLLCPQPLLAAWRIKGELYVEDVAAACYVSRTCAEMLTYRAWLILPQDIECAMHTLIEHAADELQRVSTRGEKHRLRIPWHPE